MTIQTGNGRIVVWEDFNGPLASTTLTSGTAQRYNDISMIGVSGNGTVVSTTDESGGVLDSVGAGAAADGVAYLTSPLQPAGDGTMVIEARCKNSSTTDFRFFMGFQQTASLTEPVNPYTLSGTTLTSNAAGQVVGFYYDTQATTDDFRFMAGANSAAATTAALSYALGGQTTLGALGVRCNATLTADAYFVARVELDADGTARGYFGDVTMANPNGLTHIATLKAGTLSTSVVYFPIVQLLAQSTGNPHGEIDYLRVVANRDWTA